MQCPGLGGVWESELVVVNSQRRGNKYAVTEGCPQEKDGNLNGTDNKPGGGERKIRDWPKRRQCALGGGALPLRGIVRKNKEDEIHAAVGKSVLQLRDN